jgi:hypothetical protein
MKALKSLGIPSASNPDPGTWRSPWWCSFKPAP